MRTHTHSHIYILTTTTTINTPHRLERDPEVKATLAGHNSLDLMLEGYAFRASIALPKEVTLLEEAWAAAKEGMYVCICINKCIYVCASIFLPVCIFISSTYALYSPCRCVHIYM